MSDVRPFHGIAWMLVCGVCIALITVFVKMIGARVPATQIVFLRYVFGVLFILPMLKPLISQRYTKRQWQFFGIRGVANVLGAFTWFYAMTRITAAEVVALNYLNPIYVMLGAVIFLGETVSIRRILAVGVAFIGVLIVLRPGFRELNDGHGAILISAVCAGLSYLLAKSLSKDVSAGTMVAMLTLMTLVGIMPLAFLTWEVPALFDLAMIGVIAFFATMAHYSMSRAFKEAPVTITQPVVFLQIVWTSIFAVVLLGEPVDFWVILGAAVIVSAVCYISWRETVLSRRRNQTQT